MTRVDSLLLGCPGGNLRILIAADISDSNYIRGIFSQVAVSSAPSFPLPWGISSRLPLPVASFPEAFSDLSY